MTAYWTCHEGYDVTRQEGTGLVNHFVRHGRKHQACALIYIAFCMVICKGARHLQKSLHFTFSRLQALP